MGALCSIIRNRVDDYHAETLVSVSPPNRLSKRRKLAGSKDNDIVSRISLYPAPKPRVWRETHAPVRGSRFRSFSRAKKFVGSAGFGVNSSEKMGNCLGIQFLYSKVKDDGVRCSEFFGEDEEKKEVIEIDDENLGDVFNDSSSEELEIVDGSSSEWKKQYRAVGSKDEKLKVVEKDNANEKVNGVEQMNDVVLLDDDYVDTSRMPVHKKLYNDTKRIDERLNNLGLEIAYNENCRHRHQLLRSQMDEERARKLAVDECFVPLTEEEEASVAHSLSYLNRRQVSVSHENSNIDITGEKLQCLRPGGWLNDEVINLYLALLKEREQREPQKFLKCHFFNTFFYKKLISGRDGYNYQAVRRWTMQRKLGYNLLDCEKIFVPIHQEIHWCLAIINNKDKKFQYLDSLKGLDSQVMHVLARYYVDEVKDKRGKDIDVSSWDKEFVTNLPQQENGFDCGMFMLKYIDFYSRDIGLCFNQRHMPYFRQRTAKEILMLRAE